jgi:hypothetical protein
MKRRRTLLLCALPFLSATFMSGQGSSAPPKSQAEMKPFDGVWRGQMDGLPAVAMVLTDEGGTLSGAVAFSLHIRGNITAPLRSRAGLPEPLLSLRLDGKTARFQVSHKRAHPPGTLSDRPVSFRLTLMDQGKAVLVNEDEPGSGKSPGIVMIRSNY